MDALEAAEARLKRRAALMSVAASAGLTLMKLAAGWVSGSLALISEGAHNAVDIAASGLTYFAVRVADKPADEGHPFGHAKVEAVAALAQTAFLFLLSLAVAAMAVRRLGGAPDIAADAFAFTAILVSMVVDGFRWRALRRIARETGSHALEADALHYSGDLVASGVVLVRLGFPAADSLAAIGVAAFIAVSGYRLGQSTLNALLDAAPQGLADDVRRALGKVGGVEGVEYLRLRRIGPATVGELGLYVSRVLPLEDVEAISERVRAALARRWPRMRLTIAANPLALDDETVLERVQLIAARRRLLVHHVTIQRVESRIAVSLDLEVDGEMTLGAAHEVASRLEQAIEAEFEGAIEVNTHIEPLDGRELVGEEADPALTADVKACLSLHAEDSRLLCDVHHVRMRKSGDVYYGVFHCHADADATVEAVHAEVDALERAARAAFPMLLRIIGHAEPG